LHTATNQNTSHTQDTSTYLLKYSHHSTDVMTQSNHRIQFTYCKIKHESQAVAGIADYTAFIYRADSCKVHIWNKASANHSEVHIGTKKLARNRQ